MYLIAGAGITGITVAERLAAHGEDVTIVEKRDHIGGNCYDYRTADGIFVQRYGPHIFHETDQSIVEYLSQFTDWLPYRHKVVALYRGEYYPIPINKTTISRFFGVDLEHEEAVRRFLAAKQVELDEVRTSRDVVLSKYGEELYEAFVRHYTKKQWDHYPEELDRSILERLPVRYDDNPYYFNDAFQALPGEGYTKMFERMVDHPRIRVVLDTDFADVTDRDSYEKTVFTGRIDQYYGFDLGELQYRCIDFRFETLNTEHFQPYPVVNYPGPEVEYTRCTEFKHFYGLDAPRTVILREYPSWEGEPSYPVINKANQERFQRYVERSRNETDVVFAGRSGRFRYLNMNQAVQEARDLATSLRSGASS
ncbi:MAG: UDP-galactopyranose mutase [Spirochaetales bacterium]|nr:UDP-galactopyranose mutase [Spirochaetales bacterium]